MKACMIRIGNSRGIDIPNVPLAQCRRWGEVELEVRADHLVVRSVTKPQSDWKEVFRGMHEQEDDALLDEESLLPTQWDKTEWEW